LKGFLRNNIVVVIPYALLLAVAAFFLFRFQKHEIHLFVNQYVGNVSLNAFFYYITYFGDGRLAAILLLCIFLYNVRTGIYATFSFLSAVIVSNSLKYFFYDDVNRPFFYFQYLDKHDLNLVEGVDMHIHNSFPSGHATQAFAILMCLAFTVRNNGFKVLMLLTALVTSFSRVYLSQHWLPDITAGSLIGMTASIVYYTVFIHHGRFRNLDASLLKLNRRNERGEK
jgi:membrane-associated phospholipid phosphatase